MKSSILLTLLLAPTIAQAAISYSVNGSLYSTNFDTLVTSGTSQPWTNDTTLAGWSLFNKTPAAITTINAGDGSVNTGSYYSFGTGTNSDRALGGTASGGAYFGSPAAGTLAGWIAVALTNNTATPLDTVIVGYDGEQWRNGGNANTAAQSMVLEYGFGASFTAVTTWTAPGAAFNFTSPVTTATAAAVNGNGVGLSAGRGGSITGLNWAVGDTMWVRWIENNDTGNDHGLAIDNFSFTAVPEPTVAVLAALGFLGMLRRRR